MGIEEEKKLVGTTLMGWKYQHDSAGPGDRPAWLRKPDGTCLFLNCPCEIWNPQDNDKATFKEWDEIYGKMGVDIFSGYMDFLSEIVIKDEGYITGRMYHTVPPEIRWKALIKTLTP